MEERGQPKAINKGLREIRKKAREYDKETSTLNEAEDIIQDIFNKCDSLMQHEIYPFIPDEDIGLDEKELGILVRDIDVEVEVPACNDIIESEVESELTLKVEESKEIEEPIILSARDLLSAIEQEGLSYAVLSYYGRNIRCPEDHLLEIAWVEAYDKMKALQNISEEYRNGK